MRDPVVPNPNIEIVSREPIVHSKATEAYLAVKFRYGTEVWEGYVPITYRRTGTEIDPADEEALYEHLNRVYELTDPARLEDWRKEQKDFWKTKPHAGITKTFFDKLAEGGWKCGVCDMPNNPNPQRRIQDLKEFGYTIATDLSRYCPKCQRNTAQRILLPLPRYALPSLFARGSAERVGRRTRESDIEICRDRQRERRRPRKIVSAPHRRLLGECGGRFDR